MRVPDSIFRGIGFIGEVSHEDESGVTGDLHATGFFVYVNRKRFPGLNFAYFVTAKHVAADLKDKRLYILVNGKDGRAVQLTRFPNRWWLHPTDTHADLAVLQVAEQENFQAWGVGTKDFVAADDISSRRVGVGDEVFITGLFTEAPGQSRNMPIIRHGNIAMFPEEQIQTELGHADVYLVEARSIGGISGSPAFVRPTRTMRVTLQDDSTVTIMAVESDIKLLGLMHGHWDIKESEMNKVPILHDRKQGVNLGIGIVVPASKILETVMQPDLEHEREVSEEDLGKKMGSVPGMDSAVSRRSEPKGDFTQADFEDALKKASRRTGQTK